MYYDESRRIDPPIPLDEWVKENQIDEKMIWRKGAYTQFNFFDSLTDVIYPRTPEAKFEIYETMRPKVISTHTSKSIRLPVVELRTQEGIVFTIRDNFYDYKVSVDSPVDIDVNFYDLLGNSHASAISGCYFEGFPDERIFGAYADNKRKFSVALFRSEQVYIFMWLIVRTTSPQFS